MAGDLKGLERSWKDRAVESRKKVDEAIAALPTHNKSISFSSISKYSGVSRNFLYTDKETREKIENFRRYDVKKEMNQKMKYDKTSNSKDVIIKAKDKRIAKLEEENRKLKNEVEHLRGKLYEQN